MARLILLLISLLVISTPVSASCKLPVPDGGGEFYSSSKANIFGDIYRIEIPFIFIKNGKTNTIDKISVSKIKEVYSVYGGAEPISVLRPKMQVWVWFEDCKNLIRNISETAYVQFFSTDPSDRAILDSEGKLTATQ